jgi:hypothetical protein
MKLKENKIVKLITKRKIWIRQILVASIASAFAWFLGDALVENGGLVEQLLVLELLLPQFLFLILGLLRLVPLFYFVPLWQEL